MNAQRKLIFVIPALDEEQSIVSIIERSIAARPRIIEQAGVADVEITVVSDGSTDRTVELARGYEGQIRLIVFEHNRGYGAAIMEGWRQSDAELVGFLDADGTCDPLFFVDLIQGMDEADADIALGCRLNAQSRMPLVRQVGNTLFAGLMSLFSMARIRDTASGMRVVRRGSLERIMPLPTGLHFTPAMSARGVLARDLRILEIDMPYQERTGRSKLHPWRDGLRFLGTILETAFLHRPARPLGLVAGLMLVLVVVMMAYPTWYYLQNGAVQGWMIYRFLVGEMLGSLAVLTGCAGYLGNKAADIALSNDPLGDRYHGALGWLMSRRWFMLVPTGLALVGVAFVARALGHFLATGKVDEHWSRFVVMSFFVSLAGVLVVTKVVDWCLNLLASRMAYLKSDATGPAEGRVVPPPDELKAEAEGA